MLSHISEALFEDVAANDHDDEFMMVKQQTSFSAESNCDNWRLKDVASSDFVALNDDSFVSAAKAANEKMTQ